MKITSLDRQNLKALTAAIASAMAPIEAEFGVKIVYKGASFDPESATVRLEVKTINESGVVIGKEVSDFKRYGLQFGLTEADLGKKFTWGGKEYTITGLKIKSRRYPILAKNSEGKTFKFPVDVVRPKKSFIPLSEIKLY